MQRSDDPPLLEAEQAQQSDKSMPSQEAYLTLFCMWGVLKTPFFVLRFWQSDSALDAHNIFALVAVVCVC